MLITEVVAVCGFVGLQSYQKSVCVDSSCQQNILFPSHAFGVIVSKALSCLISACWDGAFLLFYVLVLEV